MSYFPFATRVTQQQIKGVVIGRPETYPIDLQIWVESEGFRFDPPWYLMPKQIIQLEKMLSEVREKRAHGVWRSYSPRLVYLPRALRH